MRRSKAIKGKWGEKGERGRILCEHVAKVDLIESVVREEHDSVVLAEVVESGRVRSNITYIYIDKPFHFLI